MLIASTSLLLDIPFDFRQLLVVKLNQADIQFNTFADTGVTESLGDTVTVECITKILFNLRQVVLAVGVVDMGQQF